MLRQARRLYWRHVRRHPYELCHACGRPVVKGTGPAWWSATDELWYEIRGDRNGIRCMACFAAEAWEKGIQIYWRPLVDARRDSTGAWRSSDDLFPKSPTVTVHVDAHATDVKRLAQNYVDRDLGRWR